ncbi:MAG: three-Cys-motif partner protein TcmP [Sedimentisphaerales bacterium]|jgi:three-Cys-motif partner protein
MLKLPPPKDDGRFIPTVGEWSHHKHYFLKGYIDAFTTAMKNKKWAGLHYIDLFAGAGIEKLENSGKLEWGSAMIAAQAGDRFTQLHLCEKDECKYEALELRVHKTSPNAQILNGDANEKITEIVGQIPSGTLSLAFLDPYGLHIEFETLKILSCVRADLIILFPDHLDVLRNWEHNYFADPDSNLDKCLGIGADWRTKINDTPRERRAEVLRELYVSQIKTLGYTNFEYERITMGNHPLYVLIFCSRSDLAAKLWRGISQIKADKQRTFKFQKD